mmetsp:Transcript_34427/g.84399  ORF Transcript_34427/g.84399 Transcript_34427/m.84399 type:complete len:209 (-) Transcript_34427:51-677(-)
MGDSGNHTVAFHAAMFPYFLLSRLALLFPLSPRGGPQTVLHFVKSHPSLSIATLTLLLLAVARYTYVHPFLLADNRHYTFYIFRRILLRKPPLTRLAPIPLYFYGACALLHDFRPTSLRSTLILTLYLLCTAAALVPSPLVEPRYFIPAQLIGRIITTDSPPRAKLYLNITLNTAATALLLYIFLEKPFPRAPDATNPLDSGPGRFMP